MVLLIVLTAVFGTAAAVAGIELLKRRGVDVEGLITSAREAVAAVNAAADLTRPFLPDGPGLELFDTISEAAQIAVASAEQLCHIGKLEPGQRKEAAREFIENAVRLTGAEVTPEVGKLIDGAIEANVWELRHIFMPDAPNKGASVVPVS